MGTSLNTAVNSQSQIDLNLLPVLIYEVIVSRHRKPIPNTAYDGLNMLGPGNGTVERCSFVRESVALPG